MEILVLGGLPGVGNDPARLFGAHSHDPREGSHAICLHPSSDSRTRHLWGRLGRGGTHLEAGLKTQQHHGADVLHLLVLGPGPDWVLVVDTVHVLEAGINQPLAQGFFVRERPADAFHGLADELELHFEPVSGRHRVVVRVKL